MARGAARLALFDIDGTLARSVRADDHCFVRAVGDAFGIAGFSTDWLEYEHQTDSGLCAEIVRKHLGRHPSEEETARARNRLLELLQDAVRRDPEAIVAMPGARRLLEHLLRDGRWSLAIATGSWLCSARFKLAQAGIAADGIPLATSDDAPDRAEIVRTAVRRAAAGPTPRRSGAYEKIVYVGDGIWDLRAARRVGIGFVGVAAGGSQRLREAGADCVLPDVRDLDQAVAALESA
jgi:phosphoglycolate phosphatase-like HAD superfamily hydrolase